LSDVFFIVGDFSRIIGARTVHKMSKGCFAATRGRNDLYEVPRFKTQFLSPDIRALFS